MIRTKKLTDIEKMPLADGIDARMLHKSDDALITMISMKPGQSLEKHIVPVDMVFYILEGKGTFVLEDEELEISADSVVECPKNKARTWKNTGSQTLRMIAIRTTVSDEPITFLK